MKEKILVSACLLGKNCKYDGTNNYNKKIEEYLKDYDVILVCPEEMGGLSTPRIPSEIKGDKVIGKNGIDVTAEYKKGAQAVLDIVNKYGIKKAILKSRSPSCGKDMVYDGTFSHKLIKGNGITAKLLIENKVEVISSDNIV